MASRDRQPLSDTPSTGLISEHANNRYGAVLSSLYSFWTARQAAQPTGARRDAYSVITFNRLAQVSEQKGDEAQALTRLHRAVS